jgi:peroxiredoxin
MIKLFSLLTVFGISTLTLAQKPFSFSVNGEARNYKSKYIYLNHKWDEKSFTDSTKVSNGKFSFNLKSPESNMYWLTFKNDINSQPNIIFFVDEGKTTVTLDMDSLQNMSVKGGQSQKDYTDYRSMMFDFQMKQQGIISQYNQARQTNDQNAMMTQQQEYEKLSGKVKEGLKDFIKSHPKSPVSGYIIYFEYNNPQTTVAELEEVVGLLDKSTKGGKFGQMAQSRLKQMLGTTVGHEAIDFTQNNPDGKPLKLSDFKGKYVLVDFWASWCGPCRAENPNVVAAYNKYKDKGFTVLGVSFDQNKEAWLKAVEKDQLIWDQVSDLKGWGNEVGRMYSITSIPQNLLIDKDGKILAKNLRGAELDMKLEEFLNKK